MKKLLALVLALVMTLGLATVSSNAAFADADKIEHTEAVEVLNALGVIIGKENNNFDPSGDVKRSEMAKMVAMIMLGSDTDASAFTGAVTNLTDINGHWAEGWIKYCVSQGIVSGRGNGKFDPDANVTATEAAKMLLVAIGYNANVQGYGGDQWQVNVARDAQLSGFYDDLANLGANKALTRDEAAQMIFNAADATLIRKTAQIDRTTGNVTDIYSPDGNNRDLLGEVYKSSIRTGVLAALGGNSKGFTVVDLDNGTTTMVNAVATTYHSNVNNTDYTEDLSALLGEEVDVVIRTSSNKDAILGVFATGTSKVANTTWNKIERAKDTNGTPNAKIKFGGETYKIEQPHANAVATADSMIVSDKTGAMNGSPYDANAAWTSANFTKTLLCDPVKFVDIDGNGKWDIAIVQNTQIAKVSFVGSTDINVQYKGGNQAVTGLATSMKLEDCVVYDGIAKDDYVSIHKDAYSGKYIYEKLETVTGEISGTRTNSNAQREYLIDGTWYQCAANYVNPNYTAGTTIKYVAVAGLIYDSEIVSGATGTESLAMLISSAKATSSIANITGDTEQAKLLFADGTKKTVQVSKLDGRTVKAAGGDITPTTADGILTALCGELFVYEVDKDGNYELQTIAAGQTGYANLHVHGFDGSGTNAIVTGTNLIGGKTIADDAVIFVLIGDNSAAASVPANDGKVYTGKEIKAAYGTTGYLGGGHAVANTACLYVKENGFEVAKVGVMDTGNTATKLSINNGSSFGYLLVDSYTSKADGKTYQNYTIWDGANTLTVTEENGVVAKAGAIINFEKVSDTTVKNVNVPEVMTGGVTGWDGSKKIAFENSTTNYTAGNQAEITSDTVVIYVDSHEKEAKTGAIVLADEPDPVNAPGVYTDNVRYKVNGKGEVEVLLVDVTNNIVLNPVAKAITPTGTPATDADAISTALTAGFSTVTVNNDVTTATTALSIAKGQTLEIASGKDLTSGSAISVYGTLKVGADFTPNAAITIYDGGKVEIGNDVLTGTGTVTVNGNGKLTVTNDATFGGTLTVAGEAEIGGDATFGTGIGGAIAGTLDVTGTLTAAAADITGNGKIVAELIADTNAGKVLTKTVELTDTTTDVTAAVANALFGGRKTAGFVTKLGVKTAAVTAATTGDIKATSAATVVGDASVPADEYTYYAADGIKAGSTAGWYNATAYAYALAN